MTLTETPREPARPAPPAVGLFGGIAAVGRSTESLRTSTGEELLSAQQRSAFAQLFSDDGGALHPA